MRATSQLAIDALPAFHELPGGDLFWWREDGHWHTCISIDGDVQGNNHLPPGTLEEARILLVWFDAAGSPLDAQVTQLRRGRSFFLDSRYLQRTFGRPIRTVHDGVLAVCLWPQADSPHELCEGYMRLFSLLDWHSEDGDLITLHSDQSFRQRDRPCRFTEIVVRETEGIRNQLVIVNGAREQSPGSLVLEIIDPAGTVLTAPYPHGMKPFSLHRIALRELFPDLVAFCHGEHITVGGDFRSHGLCMRPYVVTEGAHRGGYHGGDRYDWRPRSALAHRLLGRGEINPVLALHDGELTTTVNLLHSHAAPEADFWVDARLYAQDGRLVTTRERWLLARRNGLSRGELADLLPDPAQAFVGHLALNFSTAETAFYPLHLQALMEYRHAHGAARVMTWSDNWNARERISELAGILDRRLLRSMWHDDAQPCPGRVFSSYFRVWQGGEIASWIGISHPGTTPGYGKSAECRLHLEDADGRRQTITMSLAAHATVFEPLEKVFPRAAELLGEPGIGLLRIESESDLACMQLSRHRRSGVWSAEHFMAAGTWHEGRYHAVSGS